MGHVRTLKDHQARSENPYGDAISQGRQHYRASVLYIKFAYAKLSKQVSRIYFCELTLKVSVWRMKIPNAELLVSAEAVFSDEYP